MSSRGDLGIGRLPTASDERSRTDDGEGRPLHDRDRGREEPRLPPSALDRREHPAGDHDDTAGRGDRRGGARGHRPDPHVRQRDREGRRLRQREERGAGRPGRRPGRDEAQLPQHRPEPADPLHRLRPARARRRRGARDQGGGRPARGGRQGRAADRVRQTRESQGPHPATGTRGGAMAGYAPAHPESIFTYGAPQLKFGHGAAEEIGYDLAQTGARRVLVVTDPGVAATGTPQRVADRMARFDVEAHVFDGAHVEPTDESLQAAVDWAREHGPWDAIVAVGGGSSIDTAKAINLLTTNPGELMDYVNKPVGGGQAPANPLNPLIAVPTTTGTGSESTTICVLDVLSLKVKTGISHVRLRPTMAVVDPALTLTQPTGVTAAAGMDILC